MNVVIDQDEFLYVQPTKAKQDLGISTKTFYSLINRHGLEKVDGRGGAVFYKVPVALVHECRNPVDFRTVEEVPDLPEFEDPVAVLTLVKDITERIEAYQHEIADLRVESTTYKLLQNGSLQEADQLKAELLAARQEIRTLQARLDTSRTAKRFLGLF